MSRPPEWWSKPRRVQVVIDNPSWMLPFAEMLVAKLCSSGDEANLVRCNDDVMGGAVAFYLGCINITPSEVMARNHRNLVVHASELPNGRGFSPLTWQILEGLNDVPVCLFEAVEAVDAGPVIYRDKIYFEGHELIDEMRATLGAKSVEVCCRFMTETIPPLGVPQTGDGSFYPRRRPADSKLDVERSIAEQFQLLRVVDNQRYPAYLEWQGHRYAVLIKKIGPATGDNP